MKKIKVLRIVSRLNIGGPSRQVIFLSHELAKRGFETVLVFGSLSEGEASMEYLFEKYPVKNQIKVPSLQREISLKKDFMAFRALVKILEEEQPNIIHSHASKAGLLIRLAVLYLRIKSFGKIMVW